MMVFGVAAVVAAFIKGLTAASLGQAIAAIGLAGLTVGVFAAFFVQRPSAALERNAIFMPWVSIVLTTFWTRMLYLDDPETLDAKLGHAAKEASDELSAIAHALRGDRRQGALRCEGGCAHAGQSRFSAFDSDCLVVSTPAWRSPCARTRSRTTGIV